MTDADAKQLAIEIGHLTTAIGKLTDKVDSLTTRILILEQRTNPIVDYFWKAIGLVLVVFGGALLALVLKDGAK